MIAVAGLVSIGHLPAVGASSRHGIDLVFADFSELAARKARIRDDDPKERSAYRSLIAKADKALKAPHVSVVEKKLRPGGSGTE